MSIEAFKVENQVWKVMDPNEGGMKTVSLDKPAPGSRAGRRVLPQSPAQPQA